jgi:hypothetical protein
MALWQFQVDFIPRAWHQAARGDLTPLFDDDGRDTAPAWREHQPALPMDTLFSHVLPAAPGRYAGELYWGSEKHTDAHVWYGNGLVEGIGVRLDARACGARLLEQIAEIANALDCVLLIPETRTVIAPNVFALSRALSASRAVRYVQGPPRFLDEHPDDGPDSA